MVFSVATAGVFPARLRLHSISSLSPLAFPSQRTLGKYVILVHSAAMCAFQLFSSYLPYLLHIISYFPNLNPMAIHHVRIRRAQVGETQLRRTGSGRGPAQCDAATHLTRIPRSFPHLPCGGLAHRCPALPVLAKWHARSGRGREGGSKNTYLLTCRQRQRHAKHGEHERSPASALSASDRPRQMRCSMPDAYQFIYCQGRRGKTRQCDMYDVPDTHEHTYTLAQRHTAMENISSSFCARLEMPSAQYHLHHKNAHHCLEPAALHQWELTSTNEYRLPVSECVRARVRTRARQDM